jgi:hypothetical protein
MIPERVIILVGPVQREHARKVLDNLPIDSSMEVVFREHKKKRTADHNSAMWAGMIADISEQAWISGRQFSKEVWHQYLKREFLPEGNEPDYDRMVMKNYRKWEEMPNGDRELIGSTTRLTGFGMGRYMERCEAYAANELGVRFTVRGHHDS